MQNFGLYWFMRHFILILCSFITCFQVVFAQGHAELFTINFKNNSSRIEEKYEPLLKRLAKEFSADSCQMIKIIGYADSPGTEEYNDMISEKRVNSVYNYLLSRGQIDTNKVYMQWMGESDEGYDLHLENAHILERSVDIWVVFNNKKKALPVPKK
jgi:outer membrane protein OmpA-like peptidoglycan-associated protein